MQTVEEWRPVAGYQDLYSVSNLGSVKRNSGKVLKPCPIRTGYQLVRLYRPGSSRTAYVHRLVLEAFVGPSALQANHKNGIKGDNRLENLEWCSASRNMQHSYDELGRRAPFGDRHSNAKLTEQMVRAIRAEYRPRVVTRSMLAKRYGVSQPAIDKVLCGENWKHALNPQQGTE